MKNCRAEGCDRPAHPHAAAGLCSTHYYHRNKAESKAHSYVCAWCSVHYHTWRKSRGAHPFCGRSCATSFSNRAKAEAARQATRARLLPVLYSGPTQVRQPPTTVIASRHRLVSGRCVVCTAWFVSFYTDITCSTACQQAHQLTAKRIAKDRRRALKKAAFVANVNRKQVFVRDGYRCHLCRRKTDPTKQVPHPRAPTLDHVIPLAQGGTHEPSNCRTACFLCNALKGDRGGGEQLLLIA